MVELRLFFPKVFPREVTLTIVAPGNEDILEKAQALGYLLVARKVITRTVQEGPVIAAALEKEFATENWLLDSAKLSPAPLHSSASPTDAKLEAASVFGRAFEEIETTCTLIPPKAFENAAAILAIAEAAGFGIICSSHLTISEEEIAELAMPKCATGGSSLLCVLQRPCAIQAWQSLCGAGAGAAMDSAEAVAVARAKFPESLVALFGSDDGMVPCHCSKDVVDAKCIIAKFFPDLEQTQTTLAVFWPDILGAEAVAAAIKAASNAGLIVTDRMMTTLDVSRASDFLALMGAASPPRAQPLPLNTLFISAWLMGTKCNKAMQLYNPTEQVVMLDDYAIGWLSGKGSKNLAGNGDGKPERLYRFEQGKFVPPGGVFVAYDPGMSSDMKVELPTDPCHSQAISPLSNGDDGMALIKMDGDESYVLDYLGDFTGRNCGRPWAVAGMPSASKHKTLIRKAHVCAGNSNTWDDPTCSSQGVNPETSEWLVLEKNTIESKPIRWCLNRWSSCPPPPPSPPVGTYESCLELLTSGPSVALAFTGKGAVARLGAILGPLDPLVAKVRCPNCIRARYGVNATRNVAHASATPAAAFYQLKAFFPSMLMDPLPISKEAKNYVMETLSPTLTAGLIELCAIKPAKPVEWLADWLVANNPNTPALA